MILFTRKRIFCAVLIIPAIVYCESTPTNIGNLTQNEDATIQSGICNTQKPCRNGGKCVNVGNYSLCSCLNGTSGYLCTVVEECLHHNRRNICGTVSTKCYFDVEKGKAACRCLDKYKVFDAKRKSCRRLCDASKNECKNGAKCEREGNYTLCACRNGTKGDFCEVVPDCENLLFCELSPYTYCHYDEAKEAAACYCTDQRFYNTKQKVCAKLCDVSKNECKNGGKCEKHGNYTFCSCRNGTSGEFCESVRECYFPSLLCGNSGETYCYFDESNGTAACKCFDGTFYNAEKKICTGGCDPNPCHNGGACYVYEGKGTCHCNLPAFAGAYCESEAKTLIVVYCVVAACIFVAIIGSCWAFRNKLKNLRAIFIKPKVDNTDNACNENQ